MRWIVVFAWTAVAAGIPGQDPDAVPAPEGFAVRVVEAATGRPVAGATVRTLTIEGRASRTPETDEAWMKELIDDRRLRESDPEERLKAAGRTFTTDDAGLAVLPATTGFMEIGARKDGLWGSLLVFPPDAGNPRPGPAPGVIELRPDRVVKVLVVDHSGKPVAGIPVRLTWNGTEPAAPEGWREGQIRRSRDPDGIAAFGNLLPPADGTGSWLATVRIPCHGPVSAAVGATATADPPEKLALPDCGAVTLTVEAAGGGPFTGMAVARLRAATPPGAGDIAYADVATEILDSIEDLVRVENGVARFPVVGLKERIIAEVRSPTGTFVGVAADIAGPRQAGERVDAKIVFGRRAAALTGRILDARKQPVSGLEITAEVSGPDRRSRREFRFHQSSVATDAEGRFRFVLEDAPESIRANSLTLAVWEPAGRGSHRRRDLGTLALPGKLPDGDHDAGVLVLPEESRIVAGRVVDEQGSPVAGAQARIERQEHGRWWRAFDLGGETDSEGRFHVRGNLEDGALRLVIDADAHFIRTPHPFDRGAEDIVVKVARGGGVEGRILTDETLGADDLVVLVEGEPARNHGFWHDEDEGHLTIRVAGGRFSCWNLREGRATLRVRHRDQKQDLAVIDSVAIQERILCDDPRVETIDLRGGVRACRITVKTPDGSPIPSGAVCARPEGTKKDWERIFLHGGSDATLAGGTRPWEVRVVAEGFRVARLRDVEGDQEVVLQKPKPVPVTVSLPADFPVPDPPYYIEVQLDWLRAPEETATDGRYWQRPENGLYHSVAFDGKREVTLQATEPGFHRLILWSKKMVGNSGGGLGLDHAPDREFEIREGSEGVRLEVVPDRRQLREFIERDK